MEIALAEEQSATPAPRLLELRAGFYVVIGLVMIFAAVARPEARLVGVAIILSGALLPALVPEGNGVSRLEAAILTDILAGTMAWFLFPADPILGVVISVWGVALAGFLVDSRNSLALLSLAVVFELAKVPFSALASAGWLPLESFREPWEVAITSSVAIVVLGFVYAVFRSISRYLASSRGALDRSQARYRALVESAPTPVLVVADETVVYANQATFDLFGAPAFRVVGKPIIGWLPEEYHDEVRRTFDDIVAAEGTVVMRNRTVVAEDGSESFVDASMAAVQFRGKPAVQIVLVDVTDRHRAEQALRVSEERFRTAFQGSATPVAVTARDTTFSQVNDSLCDMLGFSEEMLIGSRWSEVVHPDDVQLIHDAGRDSVQNGSRTFRLEVRVLTSRSETRWVRLDVSGLTDEDGDTTRFIAFVHDVTEQRAAEDALRQSEERYRSLFERLPVALYRTQKDGTILDANPALAALLGTPLQKLVGDVSTDYYTESSKRDEVHRELDERQVIVGFESSLKRSTGETIWVRDSARVVHEGDETFYEGALVDVTERHNMEKALRTRALQQEAVARLGQKALEGGEIVDVFDSAIEKVVEVLGISGAAVVESIADRGMATRASSGLGGDTEAVTTPLANRTLGSAAPIVLRGQPDMEHMAPALAAHDMASAVNVAIPGAEEQFGSLWAYCTTEDAFHDDDVSFLALIATVLAAAIERSRSRQRLEALVRSKDEFIASVSHELRTPLTVVSGMAQELHGSWESFAEEERREFIEMLVEQSRDMSDLIEDLLVAARADIGKVAVTIQRVDVASEVESVLSGLRRDALKRISVHHEDAEVLADPVRFRQIIRNLLTNAIRYGGDEITVRMSQDGYRVLLSVADDGEGIDEVEQERVFEAYQRAHATIGQPGSVGLGLTVSRTLAELMGGSLEYAGSQGSCFELMLPVAMPLGSETSQGGPGESMALGEVAGG